MKIHFITGKGGVGKSTVAAAMALQLAQTGQKVLLAELGDYSRLAGVFKTTPFEQKPREVRPNLSVAMWSGATCLKEYAIHLLKIEALYNLFFENQVSRTLINIAPALKELAMMGKITSGPPRLVGPPLLFDHLVVDAFATGHFLSLLKAPIGMSKAVPFGPMGEQSRSIDRVLRDAKICSYHIVMIPEELPVIEGMELARGIEAEVDIKSEFILNKIYPQAVAGEPLSPAFKDELQRQKIQVDLAKRRLGELVATELPFVFDADPIICLEKLAREIA